IHRLWKSLWKTCKYSCVLSPESREVKTSYIDDLSISIPPAVLAKRLTSSPYKQEKSLSISGVSRVETLSEKTEVWQRILQQVESHLNKHIFDSWFRQIKFVSLDEESRTITLSAGQVT